MCHVNSSFPLPQFFDRLQLFEEESLRHKQELSERTYKETSELLEKQLAGQFKLSNPADDDFYNALQGGWCSHN